MKKKIYNNSHIVGGSIKRVRRFMKYVILKMIKFYLNSPNINKVIIENIDDNEIIMYIENKKIEYLDKFIK